MSLCAPHLGTCSSGKGQLREDGALQGLMAPECSHMCWDCCDASCRPSDQCLELILTILFSLMKGLPALPRKRFSQSPSSASPQGDAQLYQNHHPCVSSKNSSPSELKAERCAARQKGAASGKEL